MFNWRFWSYFNLKLVPVTIWTWIIKRFSSQGDWSERITVKGSHFHFSSPQSVVPVIPTSSRTRALTLYSLSGSCWLSPLMSSPLYDRSYERQIWWLKCFCSPLLETLTLTVELHFSADSCCWFFFFQFSLMPTLMMFLTRQHSDGWITDECAVTFIPHNKGFMTAERKESRRADVL